MGEVVLHSNGWRRSSLLPPVPLSAMMQPLNSQRASPRNSLSPIGFLLRMGATGVVGSLFAMPLSETGGY